MGLFDRFRRSAPAEDADDRTDAPGTEEDLDDALTDEEPDTAAEDAADEDEEDRKSVV